MVLLSVKAGLRAGEIAKLTWPMVVEAEHATAWTGNSSTATSMFD